MPFDDESYMEDIGEYADYGTESDASLYAAEYDNTLDALMEEDESLDEDLTERRKRRGRRPGRRPPKRGMPPIPTARPGSAYRAPAQPTQGYVTQQQLKDALGRVGADVRRNAMGIKTINTHVGQIAGRVDGVVDASRVHAMRIVKLNKQMQLDGALDFAQSVRVQTNATSGSLEVVPDFSQLLKGLVKTGVVGATTGALSNPFVVGGIGFLLSNTGILTNILAPRQT
jgi:hypothetical protein